MLLAAKGTNGWTPHLQKQPAVSERIKCLPHCRLPVLRFDWKSNGEAVQRFPELGNRF